ncbi:hypothetical protein OG762_50250 (plasmid) [Streptomyces sp. NBC_01136]|uniref:hypothetical protein n=1 Tax=unclassified Streptomyces TaxID=2593676 RepID=UPI002F90C18F|nr:hypothetical protein OG762_50250 [Streptomyces sp. NBC_01136]
MADLPDLRLHVTLAPVADLWARLSRGPQAVARRAALQALEALSGIVDERVVPQLLADRLTDRLQEAGGEALVREPMGWLLGRGLVQRQACADPRCDDGIRLDTGSDCPRCEDVVQVRRAWRSRITAEADERMPGADSAARRDVIEAGLRRRALIEAEDAAIRRAKAEAEQGRRQAACAAAEARVQTEHKFAAVAEALLQAEPCADCGAQRSGGLCEACGYRRETPCLAAEAGLITAAWSAALGDADDVQAVAAAVQAALPDYRQKALAMPARTPEAEAEARRAYATEQGRRQYRRDPDGPLAAAAARQAAEQARERTAHHLLATRLEQLRELERGRIAAATPRPRSERTD